MNPKPKGRLFITIAVAVLLLCGGWAICRFSYAFTIAGALLYKMNTQMKAGQKYMAHLTDTDIQQWIERSKLLLADYPNIRSDYYKFSRIPMPSNPDNEYLVGAYGAFHSGRPLPLDLKKLKILTIDMDEKGVSYKWCGGMDHTELIIQKLDDGSFTCTARDDDYHERVIWPK